VCTPFEALKSDGCIDVVAQDCLAGREVAVDDVLDSLAQKGLTELLVALGSRPDGSLKSWVSGIIASPWVSILHPPLPSSAKSR
jgi:hypothetical protein